MDSTVFAQSVARIRFLETRMLDKSKLDALVESRDFEDCIRILQDSQYSEYVNMPSYEEGLKICLQDLYKDMYKTSPLKGIVDLLAIRYDGHNIKSLIKGKFLGIDTSSIAINAGKIPYDLLNSMIKEENFRDMPKTLRYYVENVLEDFKNTQDPQNIDIIIDKGMYDYMLETAKESDLEYLLQITRLMIDIANMKSFIRIKVQDRGREFFQKVYIKGGHLDLDLFNNCINDSLDNLPNRIAHTDHYSWVKSGIDEFLKKGDLGSLDKFSDNFMIKYLWKSKLVMFGPEPILAYILARENEIKALRIILTGKKNGVIPEIIRERLRDIYV